MLRTVRGLILVLALLPLAACSSNRKVVDDGGSPAWIDEMPVVPLEVVEYRAVEAEGEHALFMRVSRFPDRLTEGSVEDPPQITIQMAGPAVGEDLPVERIVIPDSLMPAVQVSRTGGTLTVVIEIASPDLPPYRVDEAADWVIVRLKPPVP